MHLMERKLRPPTRKMFSLLQEKAEKRAYARKVRLPLGGAAATLLHGLQPAFSLFSRTASFIGTEENSMFLLKYTDRENPYKDLKSALDAACSHAKATPGSKFGFTSLSRRFRPPSASRRW
jgi:hypothetical protein